MECRDCKYFFEMDGLWCDIMASTPTSPEDCGCWESQKDEE